MRTGSLDRGRPPVKELVGSCGDPTWTSNVGGIRTNE